MAEVVGTAYIRIKALTTGLGDDIKSGLDKGMAGGFELPDKDKKAFKDDVKRTSEEAGDEGGKSLSRRMSDSFRKSWNKDNKRMKKDFDGFLTSLKKFKIPGKFWFGALAVPALGGAIKLAASYIVTLIGQLGYLVTAAVGAGSALGGAFVGLALGALPIILAFKAETPAMDAFKESIQGQADAWLAVGAAVQEKLLPPLDQAFSNLSKLIPGFTDMGVLVGEILGKAALAASEALTSGEALGHWKTVFDATVRIFDSVMTGITNLISVLPGLFSVLVPLGADLAESFEGMLTNFANFIQAGVDSGELTTNLTLWWDRAKLIGAVLWNLVEALWEIFKVGADVVTPQFETLRDVTQEWVDFLRSGVGQAKLTTIFENALPIAQEFNRLMGDIIEMVIRPLSSGNTEGILGFLEMLRKDFLPALMEMAGALSEGLGPAMADLATAFVDVITAMAESGALGTWVRLMILLLDTVSAIFRLPGFGEFLGFLLTFATYVTVLLPVVLKLIGLFKNIVSVVKFLVSGWGQLAKLGPWIVAGLQAVAVALGISFGAVIAIIAAVIAVIVGVWLAIKNWDKILPWLKEVWAHIADFFAMIWDAVVTFVEELPAKFALAAKALWSWIQKAIPIALQWLVTLFGKIIGHIVMWPVNMATSLVQAGIAIWKWIKDAVPKAVIWLANMYIAIANWIATTIKNIAAKAGQLVTAFVKWIVDAVRTAPSKLAAFASAVWTWITTFVRGLPDKFINAIQGFGRFGIAMWNAIKTGLTNAIGSLASWGGKLIQAIKNGLINAAPGWLKGPLRSLFGGGGGGGGGGTSGSGGAVGGTQGVAAGTMSSSLRAGGMNLAGPLALATAPMAAAFAGVTGAGPLGAGASMGSSSFSGGSNLSIPPTAAPTVSLVVQIGEKDITDIVDARISTNDRATAEALFVKRRNG